MSAPDLTAHGPRVWVSPPTRDDLAPYARAVNSSARRMRPFAVPDPDNLATALGWQGPSYRTFMLRAKDAEGSHGLVGRVNVSGITRGALHSGALGYDSFDPYAGTGLFTEGLRLVIAVCFTSAPAGLGLHRVEANVQPANIRSASVLRRLGFRHEGFTPDFLYLPTHDNPEDYTWQDHDRYGLTVGQWFGVDDAGAFNDSRPSATTVRRLVVLVINRFDEDEDLDSPTPAPSGANQHDAPLAYRLSAELGIPLFRHNVLGDALWTVLADSPCGGVIEVPEDLTAIETGLTGAGLDPERVAAIADDGDAVSPGQITHLALEVRAAHARSLKPSSWPT